MSAIRRLAMLGVVLLATGCLHGETASSKASALMHFGIGESAGAGKYLIPYTTLTGYLYAAEAKGGVAGQWLAGLPARVNLITDPVALGAGEGGVYIIDGATHALYRFRWQIKDPAHADPKHLQESHGGLTHPDFMRLTTLRNMKEPNDLFVAPNGDLFISDGAGAKVVQLDGDGRFIREYKDADNLKKPVGVTVDSRGLRIFIADAIFDRVIVFSSQGRSLYAIGGRGDAPGSFKYIRSMVQDRNGLLYVVNGLSQQIQSYGIDGTFMASFGQKTFTDAQGIAVDNDNRVYLSDSFNHRLIVYAEGRVAEIYGGYGFKPGEFNQPGRISYYKGHLFVADRQNARIQIMRVVPDSYLKTAKTGGEP